MKDGKQKILLVYLKTGGGHLAPARSVSRYIEKYNSDKAETILVDGFEKSKRYVRFIVEDGYRILQNKAKWGYELLYAIHKIKFISEYTAWHVSLSIEGYLEEMVRKENPDKIVLFHFFLIKPVYKVLKKLKSNIPVITVVTDPYIAHPLWFLKKQQTFVVFSEELKKRFINKGIDEKHINVFPFILDEKFSKMPDREDISRYKTELGFTKDKILLVLGGGDGIPKGKRILKRLLKINGNFEIALVCGKNKKLYSQAVALKEKYGNKNLHIYGYVDFVYELINICDAVITKCGASTFMEILLSKKVPVVNSYIWEQEKGNVLYLVNNNMGIYEKRVNKLTNIIDELLNNEELLNKYKLNITKQNLQNGTGAVAGFIIG